MADHGGSPVDSYFKGHQDSRSAFPTLSKDPSFQKTSFETQKKNGQSLERTRVERNGKGISPWKYF